MPRGSDYTTGVVTFDRGPGRDPAEVEVAVPLTEEAMERGLQRFPKLQFGRGMLFLSDRYPQSGVIQMWIGDDPGVAYPLRISWLGANRVLHTHVVYPDDKRTFSHRGVAVLEMPVEDAQALGVRARRPVSISLMRLT